MKLLLVLLLFATPQPQMWSGSLSGSGLTFNAAVSMTLDEHGLLLKAAIDRSSTKCWSDAPVLLMGRVDLPHHVFNLYGSPVAPELLRVDGTFEKDGSVKLHLSSESKDLKGCEKIEADGVLKAKS